MVTDFTTIITEQDGIDLFQSLIDNLDNEQEVKQFIKQVYVIYITNEYSEGMDKFYELLLAYNPNYDKVPWTKLQNLASIALLVE